MDLPEGEKTVCGFIFRNLALLASQAACQPAKPGSAVFGVFGKFRLFSAISRISAVFDDFRPCLATSKQQSSHQRTGVQDSPRSVSCIVLVKPCAVVREQW
jgi:hypothetical protein